MDNDPNNHNFSSLWRDKILSSLKQHRGTGLRGLFENFMSLSVLQAANYVLPLIILPYLVRVIGMDKFGLVVFAQAVIQYFIIVTDFGFNLSATRDIATNRHDMNKTSNIFCAVFMVKLVLMLVCFGALCILVAFVDRFESDAVIYLLTFGMVIGNLLFPVWFFQGMEQMKYSTLVSISGKVLYLIGLFVFVRSEADYVLVPLLNSSSLIIVGLGSMWIAVRKFNVRIVLPPFQAIVRQFKGSSQFFLSRISVSALSTFNTLMLGIFTTNEIVGLYAAAEKLYIAMKTAFSPLGQALYPYMASRANVALFKKAFFGGLGAAVILSLTVFFLSGDLIELVFGAGLDQSADVLRLYSLIVPAVVASILLGYPFLAALGHEKYANFSIAIGSAIHLILIALLIPAISPVRVAMVTMVTETVVLGIRIYGVRKHRLWRITPQP
jgi:PST family polysaccharide transporter